MSSQAVSMYETSHREPPVSVAKLIGKALGVDWRDFLRGGRGVRRLIATIAATALLILPSTAYAADGDAEMLASDIHRGAGRG